MGDQHPSLRAQRRAEMQRTLQAHAIRLFTERGYDGTPVAAVAEAAGVSPMTVYRHFPTKEDLVLVDQHGQLVATRIAASSVAQPLVRRIGSALVDSVRTLAGDRDGGDLTANEQFLLARLRLMVSTPALRAKHLDNHYALQQTIVDALVDTTADADATFRAHAATSACLAAMHTALVRWTEDDGQTELPDMIARALTAAFGDDAVDAGPDE